ncbi:MAG: DUF4233 domain-containing protein [Nocardioidaceae bacterium]
MCSGVLGLQSVVLFLTTPVLITITGLSAAVAVTVGVGLALLAIAGAATMRHRFGYWIGSLVQLAALALGFVVPVMFALGALFGGLWVLAVVLGRRVEEAKAG